MKHILFSCILVVITLSSFAQKSNFLKRKGTWYLSWGYNRSTYANSDIHFVGPNYDFTLEKVVAKDFPTPLSEFGTYVNPSLLSIPQFNFHAGYFINDKWAISIGWDHMKYVMVNDQLSSITGNIGAQVSNPTIDVNPSYVGTYNHSPFTINSTDFLTFEHTDGFNYASIEAENYQPIWKGKKKSLQLDWMNGFGAGLIVPRSDVRLFKVGANHFWNVAGAGASVKTGLRLNFSKLLYFEAVVKAGTTRLWDIRTTGRKVDHAEQSISYVEGYGALGFTIGSVK